MEGKMIEWKVPRVSDPHFLEKPSVRTKDIVAAQTQQFNLVDLSPHLIMSETQPLPEVTKEVYQHKLIQEVGHRMIIGFYIRPTSY